MGMMFVAHHLNVVVGESVNLLDGWIQVEGRKWQGRSSDLEASLVEVIVVQVGITQRVDENPRLQVAHLGHHVGQQCVGCDVERDAEKDVGASLGKLAVQTTIGDMKLEKGMTWH